MSGGGSYLPPDYGPTARSLDSAASTADAPAACQVDGCPPCHDRTCGNTPAAPADTTLRDQIAQYARDQTTLKILDALLPLLRAHNAQVAAQAWDEGNEARRQWAATGYTWRKRPSNPYRAALSGDAAPRTDET